MSLGKSLGSRGAKPMAAGNLSTLEISLRLRPREISCVSGNLWRRGWIFQSLPPLGGARIQYTKAQEQFVLKHTVCTNQSRTHSFFTWRLVPEHVKMENCEHANSTTGYPKRRKCTSSWAEGIVLAERERVCLPASSSCPEYRPPP